MLRYAIIIFLKELKCILRDKKTFLIGVISPLILVPAMFIMVDFSVNLSQKNASSDLVVAFSEKDNCFYKFCSLRDNVTVRQVSDPIAALDNGEIAVYFLPDSDLDQKILSGEEFKISINYSESSMASVMSVGAAAQCESDFRKIIESSDFKSINQIYEIISENKDFKGEYSEINIDNSGLYLNMLAPFILILYCFIASSSTAIELSTGEKERGTWEPLLATGTDRKSIIIGKILCSSAMGFMSSVFAMIGLFGYIVFKSKSGFSSIAGVNIFFLILSDLLISLLISSACYTIGMYSKSYKESQTYFLPLSIIFVGPGLLSSSVEVSKIGVFELSVPILNIICAMKEFLSGQAKLGHFVILSIWLLIYVFVIYKINCKLIEKESIIFRE